MEEGSAAISLAEVQLHYLTMSLGEYPGLRRPGCVILRGNWKYLVEVLTFDVAKKKLVIQVSCQMRAGFPIGTGNWQSSVASFLYMIISNPL